MKPSRFGLASAASLLIAASAILAAAAGSIAVSLPSPSPSPVASPSGPVATPQSVEIPWDYGPGTFNFPAPTSGLADLGSYRSTLTESFTGTDQGQPSQWSNGYEMVVGGRTSRQLTVTGTEPVYRAELDGAAYQQLDGGACTAGTIYQPNSLAVRWEPASFLSGVTGAVEVGPDTVNGVAATHYTFDERAFGPLPPAKSKGDMWIASDGDYIVRYLVSTAGTADYFGEGTEGTLSLDYELTEANVPLAIDLPVECSGIAVDAPLTADAVNVVRVPGVVSYTTASAPKDVAAFYEGALPALGWHLTADPSIFKKLMFLKFTRDDAQLQVVLVPSDAGTSVRLIQTAAAN